MCIGSVFLLFDLNYVERGHRNKKQIDQYFNDFRNVMHPHFRREKFTFGSKLGQLGLLNETSLVSRVINLVFSFFFEKRTTSWFAVKHILDLAHLPRKTKFLRDKSISTDVHKISRFPSDHSADLFFPILSDLISKLTKHCSAN